MERWAEVQQIVYDILRLQIESGTYRYMENLLTINEASEYFDVSVDTVRAAYCRLKREGYISLSKNIGAKVLVQRNEQEFAQNIQTFFAFRKEAMIDLSQSLRPLFSQAQLIGLKHASPETLEQMEKLSKLNGEAHAPYAIWKCFKHKYTALENELLIRLAWQVYMFLHAPFFSMKGCLQYLEDGDSHEQDILSLCRQNDWPALKEMLIRSQSNFSAAVSLFCEEKAIIQPEEQNLMFCWSSYKKNSQLCYSLAVDLLIAIIKGVYPTGSFLPTAKQISVEYGVSVSTVRRAVSLLGLIGAVKSARTLGARILPLNQSTTNCDFAHPVLQRRLLDMVENLQLFALSCRDVAEITLSSLDIESVKQAQLTLSLIKKQRSYEVLAFTVLEWLAKSAPYQTIRTVYTELLQQWFWAHALRGMTGSQETANDIYGPYLDDLITSLEEPDIPRFSVGLEELLTYELRKTVNNLCQLGIPGAEKILIPDNERQKRDTF